MADRNGFTFRYTTGGWYVVSQNGEEIGSAKRTNFGWVCLTITGRRIDWKYSRRQDAANRLACERAREKLRPGPESPDVALMLNANIGQ